MEEILKALESLIKEGKVFAGEGEVKFEEDKDGNITLKYLAPKKDTYLDTVREEVNNMDDDVFKLASKRFREKAPKEFEMMATIEDPKPCVDGIKKAYPIFKRYVVEVVEEMIKTYNNEVNRLYNKYLNK